MTWVLGPEARRDEHFNQLPKQLFTRITEELLGLGIHQHDGSAFVDDDHRVGRRFQQSAKQGVVAGERRVERCHATQGRPDMSGKNDQGQRPGL